MFRMVVLLASVAGLLPTAFESAHMLLAPSLETQAAENTAIATVLSEQMEVPPMSEKVIAEVILRKADGSSILDVEGSITAETIVKYRVEQEVIREASERLKELGFDVIQIGPVGFTISGNKALFEQVFQTTLEMRRRQVLSTEVAGAERAYYQAVVPIRIPANLFSLIADVVLPIPPEYFP